MATGKAIPAPPEPAIDNERPVENERAGENARGPVRHTVHNDGVDVAYFVQGNPAGPTILLVHGWPDSHHLWDGVIPFLEDRFRLVSIDNRGAGESTNPSSYKDFQLTKMASDYVAVVDAVSPDAPVHLLGHDWGSVAGWEAVCDPATSGRFASFTSVSGPSAHHASKWLRAKLGRPTPKNVTQAAVQLSSIMYMLGSMTPGVPNAMFKLLMTEDRWRTMLSAAERVPAAQIHLGPTFLGDITKTLRVYRANTLQSIIHPHERYTGVPVQVIVGARDPVIHEFCFDDETRWNDRTWLRVLSGGHWLPFSHPQALANATVELIENLSGKPASRTLRRAELGRAAGREFDDHVVVISGAGSGIGRATALEFASLGAEIVLSDINLASARDTAALIEAAGGIAHSYQLDVSDLDAITAHAEQVVAEHGVPDILINNAGVGAVGKFLDTPPEDFARVLDINLYGVVNSSRAFGAAMAERGLGGHIVNLSSMAAYSPAKSMSAYSTSKSAVFMFSDCLRADLAEHDIEVSTICPGIVHTNIVATTKVSGVSAEQEQRMQAVGDRAYELRRYGPEKVARQIVRAVRGKRQVVPVTPEAWVQYRINRVSPALVRRAAARGSMTDLVNRVPASFAASKKGR